MSKDITEQIKSILTSLLSLTRDDIGRKTNIAFSLREFKDDFVRIYEENGIIASLTHSVLCNKGSGILSVSHSILWNLYGISKKCNCLSLRV